jgi:hypothetical protein
VNVTGGVLLVEVAAMEIAGIDDRHRTTLTTGSDIPGHEAPFRVCDIFVGVLDRRWSYL